MACIVVLDDEDEVRAILRDAFERAGHRVVTGASGREAVTLVTAHGADAVVTDIVMPGGDGVDAILRLRAQCPGVPVFVMSGAGFDPSDYLHRVVGPGRTITKPFDCVEVVARVEGALARTVGRPPAP